MFADRSLRLFALGVFVASCLCLTTVVDAQNSAVTRTDRGFLGISSKNVPGNHGVVVTYIFPTSSAETLGFQLGDQIILVNDVRIKNQVQFSQELRAENPNATMRFVVKRNGKLERIRGKLGSYKKTMARFQVRVQQHMLGKPLPKLPRLYWWDTEKLDWSDNKEGIDRFKGRITVLFAYDNCPRCEGDRYAPLQGWTDRVLSDVATDDTVSMVGVFFGNGEPLKNTLEDASVLYEGTTPKFEAALAHYPATQKLDWLNQAFLRQHGIVLVDEEGIVRYVQVNGPLGPAVNQAFSAMLTRLDIENARKANAKKNESSTGNSEKTAQSK